MKFLVGHDTAHREPASNQLARELRRNGAIIMSVFACVWLVSVPGVATLEARLAVIAVAVVATTITIILALRAYRSSRRREPLVLPRDWTRRYNLIGVTEFGAIAVAVIALVWLGQVALIPAIVCLIVGLHFFPLSRLFDQRQYRWAAVALCVVAILGLVGLRAVDADAGRTVVGFGASAVLWVTSALVSRSA